MMAERNWFDRTLNPTDKEKEENIKKYGVSVPYKDTGAQYTRQPRLENWWCTDEVCNWYGAPMRRKDTAKGRTGRKYTVWGHTDVLSRIRRAWEEGDILQNIGLALFEESKQKGTGLDVTDEGSIWFPSVSTPKRDKGFVGKTQAQSKKKYQEECAKERKKDNTPLGFVTSVNPTKKAQKKGYAGHIFAVNCDGDIVADTAYTYTKGKKIRKNNLITIKSWKNTKMGKLGGLRRRSVPKGRLRRFENIFLKPPIDMTTGKRQKRRKYQKGSKKGMPIVERTLFGDRDWRKEFDLRF